MAMSPQITYVVGCHDSVRMEIGRWASGSREASFGRICNDLMVFHGGSNPARYSNGSISTAMREPYVYSGLG